ncbi:MAG: NAD-dependent epimerase/dehydratase family protein [Chloroflexota bacterium]
MKVFLDCDMRCMVTGASGHLGSFLVRRLVDSGEDVCVLARPGSDLWRLAGFAHLLNVCRIELTDRKGLIEVFERAAPDVVFHLSWSGVTGANRHEGAHVRDNVVCSLEVLEAARLSGCSCWIGVGSQAEYGPRSGPLSEDLPTRPVTSYGVSKLAVGLLAHKLCELGNMRFVWLRLLAAYGPMDSEAHLLPVVIRALLAGRSPRLTAGGQLWDYLYVEDAADALLSVARNEGARGIFVLGSGAARSIRSIVERVRDKIDPSLPLGLGVVPYPYDQVMHLEADISRLRATTGWTPHVSLDQGLDKTIDWYRTANQRRDTVLSGAYE